MSSSLLKDGRTVDNSTIIDFDATHTNCVNRLTPDEWNTFVQTRLPDPPPPPPLTPLEKLESAGLTVADLKTLLGL